MDDEDGFGHGTIARVVSIVAAYVSHNSMRAADLPEFIGTVHASLRGLSEQQVAPEAPEPTSPAIPVKRSVQKEYLVCLEDGKKFKSLRRHLGSFHNLTPDEYRAKWNLPSDYPMVAPAYSATRSQLARESGLGQVIRRTDERGATNEASTSEETPEPSEPAGAPEVPAKKN